MLFQMPKHFIVQQIIQAALMAGQPVVALESTVISHGLPYPENLHLAKEMEKIIIEEKARPATIAIIEGQVRVGLDSEELEILAQGESLRKISVRDFAPAIVQKASGGTTVAGTMLVAERVGIKIFATGGIGGVHREAPFDISTDLEQLAKSKVVVVCAGAKSILDLPATLEKLETLGVPVLGYQTNEFPAFYSPESGLKTSARVEGAEEAAEIAKAHWDMGGGGLLVAVPIPKEDAIPFDEMESFINQALFEAQKGQIHGQAVTPFLLKRVSELSGGKSLKANLALLKNNARTAAEIAQYLYRPRTTLLA